MPRGKATHRGKCPDCGFFSSLMEDGTLYRHYDGLLKPENVPPGWPPGICLGWGKKAIPESIKAIP